MLELEGLSKSFGAVEAISGLSLHVAAGERLVILGPNGAGKTTLMRLICGELRPDEGRIRLAGRDITTAGAAASARAGIGRGFQHPSLFESLTLAENLVIAAAARRGDAAPRRDPLRDDALRAEAERVADLVGLRHLEQRVAAADHGTRRRLDLALALSGDARLILLDEPAAGIGPGGAAELHRLIASLPREPAMVVIEHDLDLAFAIADRIALMDRGRIVFDGAPDAARAALKSQHHA
ncbi:ATP-binding cassette domain-containing protein [Paracoccus sediminicola]|uniref:ATP-binding cassette domain-containing protein n=1 Tax=Paracoccus sediminicola TaxID=3017783 RepID=UPI0022F0A7CF|nr:ATP-binding cassette domain-containing protein [Paracoccus sediminicola]WBU56810.1 ATP-binding cassette domain-containing protein [Paracoccus sediminicola]